MPKAPPRVEEDDGGGLDSLLDTMTNVVGILVMVLIATQLGVKDAVTRIAEDEVIDAQALDAARAKLTLSKQHVESLQTRLAGLAPVDETQLVVQLDDLRRQMDQTRRNLDREKQTANEFALKIEQTKKRAEDAKKKIAAAAVDQGKMKAMQAEVGTALKEEARLKALLDDTPVQKAPPPEVVTLPDPRPAPPGARQVPFLCTQNKVFPIAADTWRDTIRKKAEFIVKSKRLDGGPGVGVDEKRFLAEFKKMNRSLHDDFFDIELYAAGIYPRLKFIPRKNDGAAVSEILNPRSRFQRMLSSLDTSKYYALFIVLPDSFEAYLAARAVADEKGLLSGWEPQPATWEYTTHLGGPILFGPPPPPDPNAKPAPAAPPANVID